VKALRTERPLHKPSSLVSEQAPIGCTSFPFMNLTLYSVLTYLKGAAAHSLLTPRKGRETNGKNKVQHAVGRANPSQNPHAGVAQHP
jgi:hypothetical protein